MSKVNLKRIRPIRFDDLEWAMLGTIAKKLNMTRSKIIRQGARERARILMSVKGLNLNETQGK